MIQQIINFFKKKNTIGSQTKPEVMVNIVVTRANGSIEHYSVKGEIYSG